MKTSLIIYRCEHCRGVCDRVRARPSVSEAAQQSPAVAKAAGPVPRTTEGKPDMTGVWTPAPGGGDALAELEKLYNPAARAQIQKLSDVDDPLLRCLPYGVPRAVVSSPWPFQIVQRPGMMVVLTEYLPFVPADPDRRQPASRGHDPELLRRFLRPLGRRHACR